MEREWVRMKSLPPRTPALGAAALGRAGDGHPDTILLPAAHDGMAAAALCVCNPLVLAGDERSPNQSAASNQRIGTTKTRRHGDTKRAGRRMKGHEVCPIAPRALALGSLAFFTSVFFVLPP